MTLDEWRSEQSEQERERERVAAEERHLNVLAAILTVGLRAGDTPRSTPNYNDKIQDLRVDFLAVKRELKIVRPSVMGRTDDS